VTSHAQPRGRRCGLLAACISAAVMGGSCDLLRFEDCTAIVVPGLVVDVVDRAPQEPVGDALVVAREGSFVDSARTQVIAEGEATVVLPAMLAAERAGRYTVDVQGTGYSGWRRINVRVTRDDCHVRTVQLRAELTPLE
jgi:hypothetical protein